MGDVSLWLGDGAGLSEGERDLGPVGTVALAALSFVVGGEGVGPVEEDERKVAPNKWLQLAATFQRHSRSNGPTDLKLSVED